MIVVITAIAIMSLAGERYLLQRNTLSESRLKRVLKRKRKRRSQTHRMDNQINDERIRREAKA